MMIQKTLSANGISIPCITASNLKEAVNLARNMARYGLSFSVQDFIVLHCFM